MGLTADLMLRSLTACDMSAVAGHLSDSTIDWLADVGMAPIVLAGLKAVASQPSTAASQKLTAVDLSARFESAARTDALVEILEACGGRHIDIGLLKGMLFAHEFYREPHFRPMGDIDLLIPANKSEEITQILFERGYINRALEPAEYFATHHHLMPFYNDAKRVCIEVHTGLFPHRSGLAGSGPFDPSLIQARLRTIDFNGMPIKALNLELQLMHTAVHWAEEFRRVGGILGLLDTIMLLRKAKDSLDWDWIFRTSTQAAHIAPLQLIFGYLNRTGIISLDNEVKISLQRRGKLCSTALKLQYAILDERVVLGKRPGPVLSDANLLASWKLLLHSGQNSTIIAKLMWNLMFPADAENRYKLDYQMARLKNLRSRL